MQFTINVGSRTIFLAFVISTLLLIASIGRALVPSTQRTATSIDAPDHRSRLMPFSFTATTSWDTITVPQTRVTKSVYVENAGSNTIELDIDNTNTTIKDNGLDLELLPGDVLYDTINTQSFRYRSVAGTTTIKGYYTFGGL